MEDVNIRYEADTPEEMEESLQTANIEFDRLVGEGYPFVQIVISNHWASEGIWVEASIKYKKLDIEDHLYRSNQKNEVNQ